MIAEFVRYSLTGVLNTIVGYSIFLVSLHAFGLSAFISNAVSYAVGLLVAYVMNILFVFSGAQHSAGSVFRFFSGFGVAYIVNIGVLYVSVSEIGLCPETGQLLSMVAYTLSFYLINKFFVWV